MVKGKGLRGMIGFLSFVCALLLVSTSGILHAAPTVTATLSANPSSYSGTCPATIKFEGEITVSGITKPLDIEYQFIRSDGAAGPVNKLTFQQNGTKKVSTTWTLGGDKLPEYSGWEAVKVLTRPPVESNKANFKIECKGEPQKATQKLEVPPLEHIVLQDLKIIKQPLIRIAAKPGGFVIPPGSILAQMPDLTCTIKAYYDQAKTRPIQANTWHMWFGSYTPPLSPPPWYIYNDVEVKNIGGVKAENFTVRIHAQNPTKPPQDFFETTSLEPGETVIFPYHWGAFQPTAILLNKSVVFSSFVDTTGKIAEANEGNNNCSFSVKFLYP